MDKRGLMVGVAVGAVIAGLVFGAMAQGQSRTDGGSGRYQAATAVGPDGKGTYMILDTATGEAKIISPVREFEQIYSMGGKQFKFHSGRESEN